MGAIHRIGEPNYARTPGGPGRSLHRSLLARDYTAPDSIRGSAGAVVSPDLV